MKKVETNSKVYRNCLFYGRIAEESQEGEFSGRKLLKIRDSIC